jgi:hypothetical protein
MSNDKESAAISSKGRARARVREATYVESFFGTSYPRWQLPHLCQSTLSLLSKALTLAWRHKFFTAACDQIIRISLTDLMLEHQVCVDTGN